MDRTGRGKKHHERNRRRNMASLLLECKLACILIGKAKVFKCAHVDIIQVAGPWGGTYSFARRASVPRIKEASETARQGAQARGEYGIAGVSLRLH